MKTMIKILTTVVTVFALKSTMVSAQKIDEERMERDIEVAENVLSTLLRQQFSKQRMFFPMEVNGNYQSGYGVTFRLPADFTTPMVFTLDGDDNDFNFLRSEDFEFDIPEPLEPIEPMEPIHSADGKKHVYSRTIEKNDDEEDGDESSHEQETHKQMQKEKSKMDHQRTQTAKQGNRVITIKSTSGKGKGVVNIKNGKKINLDSVKDVYNDRMIEASKNFLADYSDLIGQLAPTEKIVISNQGDQPRRWVNKLVAAPNRTHLTVEVQKGDVSQYKQGKLTRDQLLGKITVVNTETVETVEPDLELLSSIFNRLYRPDLAKTYFIEEELYYEQLKDYGAVFYMHVYSSSQDDDVFSMPTLKLRDLDQAARNKKVIELYPEFEKELKNNILEYGRTAKSIKDNEVLVFNVKLTRCKDCGIPSSLEVSVKGSVLKDFGSGKIDKNAALDKFVVKKGPNQ